MLGIIYEEGKGVQVNLDTAYNYYTEAYGNGIDDAGYRLALMYLDGFGVTQDLIKAYCLFTEISDKGHKDAFIELLALSFGLVFITSFFFFFTSFNQFIACLIYSNNIKMLETAADLGYATAQYQLGVYNQNQRISYDKALKYLTLAAKGGVTDAYYRLGMILEDFKRNVHSYSKAIHFYSEAIDNGHEYAMYRLARLYHLGKGVELDYEKAYNLYTRAADLGHNESGRILNIANFSITYPCAEDVESTALKYPEDLKNSLLMIRFIAEKGNSNLQYRLGAFYMNDRRHLDYVEAFKWYQMAASNENTDAVYQLGLLYEKGQGTVQDYRMSYRLYSQAKEKGHRESIYRLGIAYQYGLGVEINTSEAIDCYSKAAELGNNESQYKLGKLYDYGDLVEEDKLKALEWYTKAYLNGNSDVFNELYQLYVEEPFESFFYEKLFDIVSNIENIYKSNDYSYHQTYGLIYFKSGMMYLYGQGTTKNHPLALKQLLKAYYDYGYIDAGPFISLQYNSYIKGSEQAYFNNLEAYLDIQDEIPTEHLYRLGMLYYNGDPNIPRWQHSTPPPYVLTPNYSMAYRYLDMASLKEHPNAQYQMALMFLRGHGVKVDYRMALKWFTSSSKQTSPRDCYFRGLDLYDGHNAEQNHEIAEIYFQKAAEAKFNDAQNYIDRIYLDKLDNTMVMEQVKEIVEKIDPSSLYDHGIQLYGKSSEQIENLSLSSFYIRKAAEKNHKRAIIRLAKMYFDGDIFQKDKKQALEWIEKSLKIMNSNECYQEGKVFYNEKNYKISLLYMKKAAEENNGHVQAHLGLVYMQGLGEEKNYQQAMEYFEKSAIYLNAPSCYTKGMEFYNNIVTDNNYEIAALYLQTAAKENNSSAQVRLGIMYLLGLGVEKSCNTAMERIEQSIKKMSPHNYCRYGVLFSGGIEVEKNYTIALAFLRKADNQRNGFSQAQIGLMYIDGHGVPKNESEGMDWIKKSLKNINQSECYNIGLRLYNRYEREKYLSIALLFIKEAAEGGSGLAQALLGEIYLVDKGIQKRQDEESKWIQISVRNLKESECYDLGMKYYNGSEVEKNYAIAIIYLQEAKLQMYTSAQVQIGIMYLEGHGVEKSEVKAMECFQQSINDMDLKVCYHQGISFYNEYRYDISLIYIRRAAEAGYGPAQSQLGTMLLGGKAIQKNQTDAMFWIEKSIESMTPSDCYKQGMVVYRGLSVVKDFAISLRFMEKAAENHYGPAQAHLALVYYQGLGVEKNRTEVMKWVEKSTKELTTDKCYEQGMMFYNGIEVDPDYEITLLYIQKAIERHHGPSQAQLALMHLEGSGVVKNYDTAMYWIEKSMSEMKLEEFYHQGMIFYNRDKLRNNYDIAFHYLKRASKANVYAQAQLGYMYLNGIGVQKSNEEADRWHNIVDNNYIGESRYCRSKIYHYDQGGMQDFSKALKLYQEELEAFFCDSIPLTFSDALRGIGLLLEYGDGATQDFKKALGYYGRSASHENISAYYNIGLLYYYRKGVEQNYKEALIWFTKIANSSPDPNKLHVFIEENTDNAEDVTGSSKRTYSLQPDSRIYGEAHYYIGLMYNNGFFVDQDKERAQNYFKMAHIHGVERAKKYLV
jgi:TPR repeat protein